MAEFYLEVDALIQREGGYVNDPDDAGGETKYGISRRAYPHEDIRNMTRLHAAGIYRRDYWDAMRCDEINDQRVARVLFDTGVNIGVKGAVKMIQKAAGSGIDGHAGPITLRAINEADPARLAAEFTLRRIEYYVKLAIKRKANQKFLAGWVARSIEVAKAA